MGSIVQYGMGMTALILAGFLHSIYVLSIGIAIVIWAASCNIVTAIEGK